MRHLATRTAFELSDSSSKSTSVKYRIDGSLELDNHLIAGSSRSISSTSTLIVIGVNLHVRLFFECYLEVIVHFEFVPPGVELGIQHFPNSDEVVKFAFYLFDFNVDYSIGGRFELLVG
jgi:hypothetical protein